jgi:hypothetical protein
MFQPGNRPRADSYALVADSGRFTGAADGDSFADTGTCDSYSNSSGADEYSSVDVHTHAGATLAFRGARRYPDGRV